MHSPTVALLWETWRRHQKQWLTMLAFIVVFALFYPKLYSLTGLNLSSANAIEDFTNLAMRHEGVRSPFQIFQMVCILFLMLFPFVAMIVSLLYVLWVFTFSDFNAWRPFVFSRRLFTLPISTPFLASWLMVVGCLAVTIVYFSWTRIVQPPSIDVFAPYQNCFSWITMLVVSQAVVWSLNNFPVARVIILGALFYCFAGYPSLSPDSFLQRNKTLVMLFFLLAGFVMAYLGLRKIRHGDWQAWRWKPWMNWQTKPIASGRRQPFSSPAQAQLWFEWRSRIRRSVFTISALTGVTFFVTAIVVLFDGHLDDAGAFGLGIYFIGVCVTIHFFYGATAPKQGLLPFTALRPLTNGQIMMAELKALALSTLISWAVIGLMLLCLPLFGEPRVFEQLSIAPQDHSLFLALSPVFLLGLMVLTWRCSAVNLSARMIGSSWPGLVACSTFVAFVIVFQLLEHTAWRETVYEIITTLLALLLVTKIVLARWTFRTAFKQKLLARTEARNYFLLWTVLALALIVPLWVLCPHDKPIYPLILAILVALPLARVGFWPIAVGWGRHR